MTGAPFPRRILVAVDGSAPSMKAAGVAIALARAGGAALTAATVMQIPVPVDYAGALSERVAAYLLEESQKALARVAEMARKEGLDVTAKVFQGHPATEISKFAERGGFDLLVVGSRGLSGLNRMLLGSVSGALVQQARTPVLVVK